MRLVDGEMWKMWVLIACTLAIPVAHAQECGSPVDFGITADAWTDAQKGADCGIVIQGDDVVTITNYNILVFDRGGNLNVGRSRTPVDFFGEFGLNFVADVFCVFDPIADRWFIIALTSGTEFGMAVSNTEVLDLHDPEKWYAFEWDPPGNVVDYPSMSIGENHAFLTYAKTGSGGPGLAAILYIDKADLLNGGDPPALTTFDITAISGQDNSYLRFIGCVREYEEINSGYGYFITDSHVARTGTNSMVRLYALNTAEDTLVHFDLTVPEYRSAPRVVPTPDGTLDHFAGYDFKFPIYRNGSLWAAHDIGVSGTEQCQIQWYEIKINGWPVSDFDPTLEQSGVIPPPSGSNIFFPAIHVDDDGNMAIAYNQCSSTQDPAIYRRIRKWYDTDGTLRAPLLLKQSTGSPEGTNERWADFSCMEEDPAFPGVIWSHLEWFEPSETRKTWLARTDLNKSLTLAIEYNCQCEPGEIKRGTDVTLTVTGAAPGNLVRWYYSRAGCGSTYIPALGVTLEIAETVVFLGSDTADATGEAVKNFTVPANFALGEVHVQAAELENISENFRRVVIE